jgi:hypothetical protein
MRQASWLRPDRSEAARRTAAGSSYFACRCTLVPLPGSTASETSVQRRRSAKELHSTSRCSRSRRRLAQTARCPPGPQRPQYRDSGKKIPRQPFYCMSISSSRLSRRLCTSGAIRCTALQGQWGEQPAGGVAAFPLLFFWLPGTIKPQGFVDGKTARQGVLLGGRSVGSLLVTPE